MEKNLSVNLSEPLCAMNTTVIDKMEYKNENQVNTDSANSLTNNQEEANDSKFEDPDTVCEVETCISPDTESTEVRDEHVTNTFEIVENKETLPLVNEDQNVKLGRERKLSLDQTMLNNREEISLQRKSSFFKKRFDSFIRNTTDLFHKQSIGRKSQTINRRDYKSISLQSLNEKSTDDRKECSSETLYDDQGVLRDSTSSLHSCTTPGISVSGAATPIPDPNNDVETLTGSQPTLSINKSTDTGTLINIKSLIESPNQAQTLLNSRALSMSSGLDTANGHKKRKSSIYKRTSWFGNERNTGILEYHSYQDFGGIPEDSQVSKSTTRERRLSYQRAVSGEDYNTNVFRNTDTLKKKNKTTDNHELVQSLADIRKNGIPSLKNFTIDRDRPAFSCFKWIQEEIETFYDWNKIPSKEEQKRQAVIRELVTTDADYLKHLLYIVDVCIATAHFLQEDNHLLFLQTDTLFSNLPDVLLAGLDFFEITFCPMINEAIKNNAPFTADLIYNGFNRFRELFEPYERYLNDQPRLMDYLRYLNSNPDFQLYANWCKNHESSNRLSFNDILIKPMQRLTKYGILLDRIAHHTTNEPERTLLLAMEALVKNHVLDLNRSVRQKQEVKRMEDLHAGLDGYEIEFRDEDMDVLFRSNMETNLLEPMINCLPCQSRMVIHEADMRFKDHTKEMDARVIILTDMILVCKKLPKNNQNLVYKLIRPKFMIDQVECVPKYNPRNQKEYTSLLILILDAFGSSTHCFTLTEISSKEPNPQNSLKLFELKIREAKLTYEYSMWVARNPSCDVSEIVSSSEGADSDSKQKLSAEDMQLERDARERVAAMLHLHRAYITSTDNDISQSTGNTDSFEGEPSGASNSRRCSCQRYSMNKNSTGNSSRNSRLSSFQQSTSAASHDEPQPGPSRIIYKEGSSVEHVIPPFNPEDGVTSITVKVMSESESETTMPSVQAITPISVPSPMMFPPHQMRRFNKNRNPMRSGTNTLRVQPRDGAKALVHSLPDLSIHAVPFNTRPPNPASLTPSYRLYQSHQEELQQRNMLAANHQYLSPDNRGTSYPPPSPVRPLKRSLAFCYTLKNPPLEKMGHVNSQWHLQAEPSFQYRSERNSVNSTTLDKTDRSDKKEKSGKTRHNNGRRSLSPTERDSREE